MTQPAVSTSSDLPRCAAAYTAVVTRLATLATLALGAASGCSSSAGSPTGPGGPGPSPDAAAAGPPASVANLFVWLEADAGVQLAGSNVTQWNDQSGHGYNAFQPSAALQPTLASNALAGLPVVSLNGSQKMRWPATTTMSAMSVFTVYQLPTAFNYTAGYHPLVFGGPTNTAGLYVGIEIGFQSSGTADSLDIFGGFSNDARATMPGIAASGPGTPYKIIDWVSTNSHATAVFVDGAPAAMSTTGSAVPWTVPLGSGGASDFGGIGSFSLTAAMAQIAPVNFAEIIVYDRALSDPERQQIEGYLAAKWHL
jgi:hypothetical protein